MPLYPITFSIPLCKIVDSIPDKKRILSSLIPGDSSTYIYNTEEEYYNQYKESMFAITKKKAGWDCLRHYEILACGTIPVFTDINFCPINTMALWPKDLLNQANLLYNKIKLYTIDTIPDNLQKDYYMLLDELMQYLHNHLTTTCIAKYVLSKTNMQAQKILYLSACTNPDYLRCLTLIGFKELFGANCHDYCKIPHIYNDYSSADSKLLYGKGITYTKNVKAESYVTLTEQEILENIKNKKYDLIIYGSYHRGMPFYHDAIKFYTTDKIVIMCGEDIHYCESLHEFLNKGHPIFVREF